MPGLAIKVGKAGHFSIFILVICKSMLFSRPNLHQTFFVSLCRYGIVHNGAGASILWVGKPEYPFLSEKSFQTGAVQGRGISGSGA